MSRAAEARRTTGETDVRVRVDLDGTGTAPCQPAWASSTTC